MCVFFFVFVFFVVVFFFFFFFFFFLCSKIYVVGTRTCLSEEIPESTHRYVLV